MDKCTNCDGTGLTGGNPERPWEHVGAVKTCEYCNGKGVFTEQSALAPEPAPEEAPKAEGADASAASSDGSPTDTVDNSSAAG